MKSSFKYFILAIVACGAGYLFGAYYGLPCADESQTAGDINRTNVYKTIISNPDEQMPLIKQRLSEFVAVSNWACVEAEALTDEDAQELKDAATALATLQKKCKKAENKPDKAYDLLSEQIKAGKKFVTAADKYLSSQPEMINSLASIRDIMASFCTQNALITQNDDEIDYWSNAPALLLNEDMVYSEPEPVAE